MKVLAENNLRARLLKLAGVLATALSANTALSLSYASLINALSGRAGASTRTALLLNMWAFALIFCSHRYPHILKKWGTRRCAVGALALSSSAIAMLAASKSFSIWLAAEALQGIAFGLFYVAAETWINSAFEDAIRNRINALYLAVQSLGFATGPIIVSFSGFGITTCFAVAAAMMAVAALVAVIFVPDDRPCEVKNASIGIRQFGEIARQLPWVVVLGTLTGTLDNTAWSLLTPFLRMTGYSDAMSMFALTIFVWGQTVLLMPLGYYADKAGEQRLMKIVASYVVVYCLVLTQAHRLPELLVLAMTFMFGPACFSIYGAALSLAGKRVRRDQLAVASASLVTGWCLGGFVGSILVGVGMDLIDVRAFPLCLLAVAGGIAAVVMAVVPTELKVRDNNATVVLPRRVAGDRC
ncbi:MAG: MFS transporter [Gammaproteobacteria bacterium]